MYLQSLATAVPTASFSQPDCWRIVEGSAARSRLKRRSMLILHSILRGDHGIERRHFAVPDVESVFDRSSDALNQAFRTEAPALAARALGAALEKAGAAPGGIDALLICTCTGYLCPGVTSYVAERLGLRQDALLQDMVGLGCGAAIPTLRAASHLLAAHPGATVACVAVEICSAAFYLDDDPGVIISACLFSDGAAATLWRASPGPSGLRAFDFSSLHLPEDRDKLRFEQRDGKLRNLLHRSVPELAAGAVGRLWGGRGPRPGRGRRGAPRRARRPRGAGARRRAPPARRERPDAARPRKHEQRLGAVRPGGGAQGRRPRRGGDFWLVSFGAGFSAHSCRLGL